MATATKPTTPKVTRPARARAGTPKPATASATTEPANVADTPAETAPKLEETTVVVDAPPAVVELPSEDDGTRKEGFVLEPAGASKNYARFKVPAGIGCVESTLYAPLDTKTVKILLIRES